MSSIIESARTLLSLTLPLGAGAGKVLMSDGSGVATWQDVIPVGTKMVFYQASAPLGWWTAVALNDYFLRVVTAGGSGGSAAGAWTAIAGVSGNASPGTDAQGSHSHGGRTDGLTYDINTANVDYGIVDDGVGYQHHLSGPTPCHLRVDGGANNEGQHDHNIGTQANHSHTVNSHAHSFSGTHGYAQHKYADIIICSKN